MSPENEEWRKRNKFLREKWSYIRPSSCLTVRWYYGRSHIFMWCVRERSVFR